MIKLPNPVEVRERLKNLSTTPKESAPKYNIIKLHNDAINATRNETVQSMALVKFGELIHPHLHNANVKKLHIGWNVRYKSLTFSLFDKDELKSHIIRHSVNPDGEVIKWRTFGSKTFTPSRITDHETPLYVSSGIGEYVLFELMGVDYIVPQCDSVTSGITPVMIEACEGRVIVYLQDNDDSARKLGDKLQELFKKSYFVVIDFERVHDEELPKGYDFRDFCNDMAIKYQSRGWEAIESMIQKEIRVNTSERGGGNV